VTRPGEPISPDDVGMAALKRLPIPPEVFDAFNDLIVKNWAGGYSKTIRSVIREDDVVAEILKRLHVAAHVLYDNHWLDIEPAYTKAGWTVSYDSKAREDGDATFTFAKVSP
jgi:hypothetical protein